SYHALQAKFDRRFSGGFATTTTYTYGKGMGFQTGDDGGLAFYINQRRNYARNDYDRTHTFVQSIVYDLPVGKGKRFLSSGFAAPAGNAFGNVGRNYLSGPNFFDLDASLAKSVRFTERFSLDLRLEAFGVTNTPQFYFNNTNGTPAGGLAAGTTLGSSSFGQIT